MRWERLALRRSSRDETFQLVRGGPLFSAGGLFRRVATEYSRRRFGLDVQGSWVLNVNAGGVLNQNRRVLYWRVIVGTHDPTLTRAIRPVRSCPVSFCDRTRGPALRPAALAA